MWIALKSGTLIGWFHDSTNRTFWLDNRGRHVVLLLYWIGLFGSLFGDKPGYCAFNGLQRWTPESIGSVESCHNPFMESNLQKMTTNQDDMHDCKCIETFVCYIKGINFREWRFRTFRGNSISRIWLCLVKVFPWFS